MVGSALWTWEDRTGDMEDKEESGRV